MPDAGRSGGTGPGCAVTSRVYEPGPDPRWPKISQRGPSARLIARRPGRWETARMGLLLRIVVNAFAIWIVTLIDPLQVSVIPFEPGDTLQLVLTLLLVALIFALVNTLIGTVIKVLAFPLYILTLGLIGLIINAFLLWLTGWITEFWSFGLRVEDFWWGVVAALIITLINWVFGLFLRPKKQD
jgi:putative membrane protein